MTVRVTENGVGLGTRVMVITVVHAAKVSSTRGGGAIYRSLFLAVLGEHGEVSPVGAGAAS